MPHYLQSRAVNRPTALGRRKVLLRCTVGILLATVVVVTSGELIKQWQAGYCAERAMESAREGRLDEAREQIDAATALTVTDLEVMRVQTFVYSLRNERIATDLWDELSARVELTEEEMNERERLRRYVNAACSSWIPSDSPR